MTAAKKGWTKSCLALVKAGADVNFKNGKGENALMMAANGNHVDTVVQLIGAGANPTLIDDMGNFAHNYFSYTDPKPLKDALVAMKDKGVDLNDESAVERSKVGILSAATHKKDVPLANVQFLIEELGLNPSGGNNVKKPPVFNVADSGNHAVLEYLLAKGADPNAPIRSMGYSEGLTPLVAAIVGTGLTLDEKKKGIELLVQKGAKIDEKATQIAEKSELGEYLKTFQTKAE